MSRLTNLFNDSRFRRAVKIVLPGALAAVCLYYILISFEWTEIWRILQRADVYLFLCSSISATIAFWFLRALRWAFLLRGENLDVSFFKLYLYTAIAVGFANFTPFQSGEAVKVEMFRKYGGTRLSGYTFFFLEKLLDLLAIALLSLGGVFSLFEFGASANLKFIVSGLIIGLMILAAATLLLARKWREKSNAFDRRELPNYKTFAVAFLLTAASWTAMILGWKYIFQSVDISLTMLQTTSVISLTTIVSLISLVPGAVGVSEVTIAALLSRLGYEDSIAQAGAVMMGVYSLLILALAGVHLILLKVLNLAENKAEKNLKQTEKIV